MSNYAVTCIDNDNGGEDYVSLSVEFSEGFADAARQACNDEAVRLAAARARRLSYGTVAASLETAAEATGNRALLAAANDGGHFAVVLVR